MNRIKSTLTTWMRSLPLRGEEGWVAPRSIMALVAVLGLVGLGVAAQTRCPAPHSYNTKPLDHYRSDLRRTATRRRQPRGEQCVNHPELKTRRATMLAISLPKSALAKSLAAWLSTLTTWRRMSPTASAAPSRSLT